MTDRLMRSLGQVAREQADHDNGDDRWRALCNGELSAEEEEDLRLTLEALVTPPNDTKE